MISCDVNWSVSVVFMNIKKQNMKLCKIMEIIIQLLYADILQL